MEILFRPCLLVRFLPLTPAEGAMPDFGRCRGGRNADPPARLDAAMMRGIVGAPATASCLRVLRGFGTRALPLALVSCVALVSCSNPFDSKVVGSSQPTTTTVPNTPMTDDAGTSQPTGKTYSVPRTIASDCSSDVTSPLSKWIASVPDNSTLMLGRAACYRVDGSLTIANRRRLLVDGNGATLKATTRGSRIRVHVAIDNSENIIVRNLIVKGANPRAGAQSSAYNPQFEAQHGFNLGGVRHVLLDNVQASDVYGDFVYVSSSGQGKTKGQPSEHVAVVRSRFSRSGRQGIAITNARDVTIRGNVINDVARSMFDLEPNTERNTVRDIRIEQNTTGKSVNFWIASKGAGNQIGDILVRDNTMRSPTGGLVFIFGGKGAARGPFTLDGNRLRVTGAVTDEGAKGALFFAHTDRIEIRNNQIDLPRGRDMPTVELRSCNHVAVDGNRVQNAKRLVMADQTSTDVRTSG
jgi:Right handed beta helix region